MALALGFIFSLLLLVPATSYAAQPDLIWAKRLGNPGVITSEKVAVGSNGNTAIVGKIYGDADLNGDGDATDGGAESAPAGTANDDMLLSVTDSTGAFQWAKRLGGVSNDSGRAITIDDSNNIVVVGHINGDADVNGDGDRTDGGAESATGYGNDDIIISVFNSTGTFQWAKRLGGTNQDDGLAVAIDQNNRIVVSGYVDSDADLNGDGDSTDGGAESATGYGLRDIFASVFDSTGAFQWATRLGGTSYDAGNSLAVDSNNNIILGGGVLFAADLNGDGDSTDGIAETGSGYDIQDAFVTVFSPTGTHQWAKRLGGASGSEQTNGVFSDSNNNVVVVGKIQADADLNGDGDSTDGGAESATGYGAIDAFVSVFNSSGTYQWAKRLGGTNNDTALSVTTDSLNNVLVTGNIKFDADLNGDGDSTDGGAESKYGTVNSEDVFVTIFNTVGQHIADMRMGGLHVTGDTGYGIALAGNDTFAVTGVIAGPVDLNSDGDSTDGMPEIGYRNSFGDAFVTMFTAAGTTDPDTTAPSVSLTPLNPDPNIDTTPTLSGTATDDSEVVSVQFQMDGTGGSWSNCVATDGTFDEASDAFTCTPSPLTDTQHTMYVRATDSSNNTTPSGSYASDTFSIVFAPTVALTPLTPDPNTDRTPTLLGSSHAVVGTITSVQYQVDSTSGSWKQCKATDGHFNQVNEDFKCTTAQLSYAGHTIYVLATDSNGGITPSAYYGTDTFTIVH